MMIKIFLLEHYSDFGDITTWFHILIVKDKKINPHTDYNSIEDILGYFTSEKNMPNLNLYKNYSICEYLFKNKKL